MGPIATRVCLFETAADVAAEAARRILAGAREAIATRGRFRVVLAGGTTPLRAYRVLAGADADWSAWEVWFGDERCLPPGHTERNDQAADLAFLGQVPIPRAQIHPIAAQLGAERAALAYEPVVQAALPFDLVLLGMGEDGHTASLFPGHAIPSGVLVMPVQGAPKPPPDRVSLTPQALTASRELLILVTGAGKREAVAAWRAGADLPVARVAGQGRTITLLDQAAAGPGSPGGMLPDLPPPDPVA
jgi:6-phosphogluconolactonase